MDKQKLSRALLPLFVGLALLPLTPAESVTFKPKGSPQKTVGGASRGICLQPGVLPQQMTTPQRLFTALIPPTKGELTAAAYPTLLVKILASKTLKAEFTLWDENGKGIYQTTFALPDQPGIMSFQLPSAAGELAISKQYKWSVAVICNPAERQRDVVLQGGWQRVKVSSALTSQLEAAQPLQKVKVYAENGLWYDTIATLAELKRSLPEDPRIASEWQELLQSVGLTELSQVPIVNCCQTQS